MYSYSVFVNIYTGEEIPGDALCDEMQEQLANDPDWYDMYDMPIELY